MATCAPAWTNQTGYIGILCLDKLPTATSSTLRLGMALWVGGEITCFYAQDCGLTHVMVSWQCLGSKHPGQQDSNKRRVPENRVVSPCDGGHGIRNRPMDAKSLLLMLVPVLLCIVPLPFDDDDRGLPQLRMLIMFQQNVL